MHSIIIISLIILISGININYSFAQTDFVKTNNFGTGISQNCDWYDMDMDGDMDIAISNVGKSYVFQNDGNNNFTEILKTDTLPTRFVKWIDIDNDGLKDFFVGNNGDCPNYVYYNKGDGTFVQAEFLIPIDITGISRGDIDKDGDYDVVLASWSSEMIFIFKNDGYNNYDFCQSEYDGGISVEFADVDNDSDADIILGNGGCIYQSIVYKNDGTGFFTLYSKFGTPGLSMTYLSLADVDNDNDVDITSSTDDCDLYINIYLNDGSGNFTTMTIDSAAFSRAVFGDIDNDSDEDLVVGTIGFEADHLSIYYNDYMNFTKHTIESNQVNDFPFDAISGISLGDSDNDGDLDIAITKVKWTGEFEVEPLENLLYINTLVQDIKKPHDNDQIIKIFPNPATDFVNISLTKPVELLKLINSSGMVVLEKKVSALENRIDVSNLHSGVYSLQIISERNTTTMKIVIIR